MQRDSINYFPPSASRACRIGFFSDLSSPRDGVRPGRAQQHARVPGPPLFQGARRHHHGQYWLNVKFENSLLRVPFRVLTEDEEKLLSKNYKDISKQVKDAFRPKK